ncbi:DUF4404 family protein [Aquabacterium sp.]|uniref:DUF4404 family protein n=1 Tax=Aquabacterium sp. TaxID=1872578 RepID=UPI002E3333B9|nr:DUF4404 family protein [Aquabacterium sp.]HEX5312441.1 DUF4404 family protein [Aquabacterium sp.]
MDNQKIKQTLEQLHAELEAGQRPDPELRAILQTLAQDIHRALEQPATAPTDEGSLEDRARDVSAKFAAQHPYLEATLRDLMDGLGKIGI